MAISVAAGTLRNHDAQCLPEDGLAQVLGTARTEQGTLLQELADRGTILLIFLRHFGCSYCRQAIADVAALGPQLAEKQVQPVFVHLGSPERARPYFEYYGLGAVERISDPEATLYKAKCFELPRTHPLSHFFIWKVVRTWLLGGVRKYGIGLLLREDSYQMPGVFVLRNRAIVSAFRFRTIADQPDYLGLIPE